MFLSCIYENGSLKIRIKKETTPSVSICPCGSKIIGKPAWIACDSCSQWWHCSCVNLTKEICGIFRTKNLPFLCPECIVSRISEKKGKVDSTAHFRVENRQSCDEQSSWFNVDDTECKVPKGSHDLNTTSSKVIIVDSLKNPSNFQNSRVIKQEIRKYKGNIQEKYAYPSC